MRAPTSPTPRSKFSSSLCVLPEASTTLLHSTDYTRWGELAGRLAAWAPHLVALDIDDFTSNIGPGKVFTVRFTIIAGVWVALFQSVSKDRADRARRSRRSRATCARARRGWHSPRWSTSSSPRCRTCLTCSTVSATRPLCWLSDSVSKEAAAHSASLLLPERCGRRRFVQARLLPVGTARPHARRLVPGRPVLRADCAQRRDRAQHPRLWHAAGPQNHRGLLRKCSRSLCVFLRSLKDARLHRRRGIRAAGSRRRATSRGCCRPPQSSPGWTGS